MSKYDDLMKLGVGFIVLALVLYGIYSFVTSRPKQDSETRLEGTFELGNAKYYEEFDETTFGLIYKGTSPVNVTVYNEHNFPYRQYLSEMRQGDVRTTGFKGYATSCIVNYNGHNVTFTFAPERVP